MTELRNLLCGSKLMWVNVGHGKTARVPAGVELTQDQPSKTVGQWPTKT